MGQSVVDVQLYLFRVDEYQLQLVGLCLVEQADDDAVYADRLTHSGRAGNEQMRHFCNIEVDRLSRNVLSESGGQTALR